MIQSHIASTRTYGVVLKLKRFSHLSGRSFGLSFSIELGYLSFMLSLRTGEQQERLPGRRSKVKVMQSVSHLRTSDLFRARQ